MLRTASRAARSIFKQPDHEVYKSSVAGSEKEGLWNIRVHACTRHGGNHEKSYGKPDQRAFYGGGDQEGVGSFSVVFHIVILLL